ncbi:MAG: endonuclease/exonuclease/phosphatase family protein [Planctomycetes bacterium]|nr:endonuclease/exonuclease/phosphatase family protein [Planctomycetota bacterium]
MARAIDIGPSGRGLAVLSALLAASCIARPAVVEPVDKGASSEPVPCGVLDLLTFNVAGLPGFVAKVDGRETHPRLGAELRAFDLVLLQEDFWYHDLIEASHRWQAAPRGGGFLRLGDGLARFSRLPLEDVEHVPWTTAHGLFGAYHDRWAWKGFAAGRVLVAEGRSVWVYNVHFDAGGERGDREARAAQRQQLIEDILVRTSESDALIVAGDFNCGLGSLDELRERAALEDSGGGGIDRVLYRSGADMTLRPSPDAPRPRPDLEELWKLSDHAPVWVRFAVE